MISKELLDILVCPKCKGNLDYIEGDQVLDCVHCQLRFPVKNDIPVMLEDEAEQYS